MRNIELRKRLVSGFVGLVFTFVLSACGKPFNVQPKPKAMTPSYKASVELNGLRVDAGAVTDEDQLYDTFEANLLLAGVLPVNLKLANTQKENITLKNARFTIKAQNQTFKSIDAKSAYKRLMKYYSISIYNKAGYKESREDFSSYEINVKNHLAENEQREGLMFFAVPDDVIKGSDLTLVIEKLSKESAKDGLPIELKLK